MDILNSLDYFKAIKIIFSTDSDEIAFKEITKGYSNFNEKTVREFIKYIRAGDMFVEPADK